MLKLNSSPDLNNLNLKKDSDICDSTPSTVSTHTKDQSFENKNTEPPAIAGSLVLDKKLKFEDLKVDETICKACYALGFKHPSDIQTESIPLALEGRDIIGLAETGSGKTAAFAIPILHQLLDNPQAFYALVLAPTRELAYQISEQFQALGSEIGVKCAVLIGGMDMISQAVHLAQKPNVVIATPGRIVDHLENTKGFNLRNLKCLVIDEADRLLNLDFEKEINTLLKAIPQNRQTFLFSATMTSKVAKLQRASLSNPVKIEVSRRYQTVKTLKEEYVFVPAKYKDVNVVYILNNLVGKTMIIFVNQIRSSIKLTYLLRNLGFGAIAINGKMAQTKRLGSLNKFKAGGRQILVATDVASRGLDLPAVDIVMNYDVPTKSKDYIHRVGRTARAGRSGLAISIVTQYDVELFQRIEKLIGHKMTEYPNDQTAVMLFHERVCEAQRLAAIEIREEEENSNGKFNKKGKKRKNSKFLAGKSRFKRSK